MRFGAFSLFLPALLDARSAAIGAAFAGCAAPRWRPAAEGLSVLPHPAPPPEALASAAFAPSAASPRRSLALERLDALARAGPEAVRSSTDAGPASRLGWKTRPGGADPARASASCAVARPTPRRRACGGADRSRGAPRAAAPPRRGSARRSAARQTTGRPDRRTRRRRRGVARAAAAGIPGLSEAAESCRVDVWLWRARFFKTRSLAARIIEEGGVRLSRAGSRAPIDKPSRAVHAATCLPLRKGRDGWRSRSRRSACAAAPRPRRGRSTAPWTSERRSEVAEAGSAGRTLRTSAGRSRSLSVSRPPVRFSQKTACPP